tara:strand:+ start:302 stop:1498 length:1197 start_codon:yes stop_codon:yes gene_type:complete
MKWIGQHIYDLISRFRSDVYLEDVSTGTIASGGNLGLDSNNKIVKATEASGDLTSIVAGTGLSGTSLTGPIPTLNVDASQTQITAVGTIATGVWNGTAVASAYLDADTAHLTTTQTFSGKKTFSDVLVLDGDRNYSGEGGLLHLDASTITDTTTSASGTLAEYRTVNIEAMSLAASNSSVTVTDAASVKIQGAPSAGTNVTITNPLALWVDSGDVRFDGTGNHLGTITAGTWNGTAIASDQQKHVMHYQLAGYGQGDGTNYEVTQNINDNNAPFEHNTNVGSDGTTAITVANMSRTGGHVMPRACTLKRWTGWGTCAGSQTVYIGLFKASFTRDDSTNVSLVLLDEFSYTAMGNNKMEDFDETSFTATAIAAGDMIITAIKSQSGYTQYFNSTVEVEF